MDVLFYPQVRKFVDKLSERERLKVNEYIELFREYTFTLEAKYLKKVGQRLWELRPGSIRLFFVIVEPNCIIIYAMRKKSQKITRQTMVTLKQKMKKYL